MIIHVFRISDYLRELAIKLFLVAGLVLFIGKIYFGAYSGEIISPLQPVVYILSLFISSIAFMSYFLSQCEDVSIPDNPWEEEGRWD